jgi:hypothetical protein
MFKEQIYDPFFKTLRDFGDLNAFCINEEYYTYEQFGKRILTIAKYRDWNNYKR